MSSDIPTLDFDDYTRPFRDRVHPPVTGLRDGMAEIVPLTGPGSVTDPAAVPAGVLPGINDDDALYVHGEEGPTLIRRVPGVRIIGDVDSGEHASSSQAGHASFRYAGRAEPRLPYPDDEVSNSLVELDLAEEAAEMSARARTADRLADAYHRVQQATQAGAPYAEWVREFTAAAAERDAAYTEWREVRGL